MIIQDKDTYKKTLEALLKEPYLAVDTETTEFTKENDHSFDLDLIGVECYGEKIKCFIPTELLDKEFQKVLEGRQIILHNAKFDLVILQKHGFDIDNIKFEDTMVMSWLLNENRSSHALKYLAGSILKVKEETITKYSQVTKQPTIEDMGLFADNYEAERANWLQQLGEYCIKDCEYTYKLFFKFKPEIEAQEIWKDYEKVELPMIRVLLDMEKRGIKVDTEYLKNMEIELQKELARLQQEIWELAGRQFDINSPKQLTEILYKERKYEVSNEYLTTKGTPSTDVHALKYLGEKYPEDTFMQKLLEYRELFKLQGTYVKGILDRQRDGVIYASFNQLRARTGRLSSSNPNCQQIPSREDKYDIRKAFIPREGYVFIDSDLSQIELRMIAYFSKDQTMINIFKSEGDIHAETAKLLGVDRKVAKSVNFGISYGTSAYGMAKNLGITTEEAETVIRNYFNRFKNLALFMVQCKNTLKKKYAIQTLFKRKRRFPEYAKARKENDRPRMSSFERQSVNSVIQGSSADLIKFQMIKVHQRIKEFGAYIILTIHDEIIVECPRAKAEDCMQAIKYEMETAIKLGEVPIITEPEITEYWKK